MSTLNCGVAVLLMLPAFDYDSVPALAEPYLVAVQICIASVLYRGRTNGV